jgi:hypothetical protein
LLERVVGNAPCLPVEPSSTDSANDDLESVIASVIIELRIAMTGMLFIRQVEISRGLSFIVHLDRRSGCHRQVGNLPAQVNTDLGIESLSDEQYHFVGTVLQDVQDDGVFGATLSWQLGQRQPRGEIYREHAVCSSKVIPVTTSSDENKYVRGYNIAIGVGIEWRI